MLFNFFLGDPGERLIRWYAFRDMTFFQRICKNLERFEKCSFKDLKSTEDLGSCQLPEIGTYIPVQYRIENEFVKTDWLVLGYNGIAPQYVKYMCGDDVAYGILYTDNGEYVGIGENSMLLASKSMRASSKGKISAVEGSFTYGATSEKCGTTQTTNSPRTVPMAVYVGDTKYTFAGYNMQIMSGSGLRVRLSGTDYTAVRFHVSGSDDINGWHDSLVRQWLNTSGSEPAGIWSDNGNVRPPGMLWRINDDMAAAVQTAVVNTFACYAAGTDDGRGTVTSLEKFWLAGCANVNFFPRWSEDSENDNVAFTKVFTSDSQGSRERIRYLMDENGGISSDACSWWLRTADATGQQDILVGAFRSVINQVTSLNASARYGYGCIPMCAIGG